MRSTSIALAATIAVVVLGGCEVEASLGAHDAGFDAASTTCHPPVDAGTCSTCQAALCCDEFTACSASATCPCLVDCTLSSPVGTDCALHCGGVDHGEHGALVTCARAGCAGACP